MKWLKQAKWFVFFAMLFLISGIGAAQADIITQVTSTSQLEEMNQWTSGTLTFNGDVLEITKGAGSPPYDRIIGGSAWENYYFAIKLIDYARVNTWVRWVDMNNYISVFLVPGHVQVGDTSDGRITCTYKINGVYYSLSSSHMITWASGDVFKVEVQNEGTTSISVKTYHNGNFAFEWSVPYDAAIAAGSAGLGMENISQASFTDIIVGEIEEDPEGYQLMNVWSKTDDDGQWLLFKQAE